MCTLGNRNFHFQCAFISTSCDIIATIPLKATLILVKNGFIGSMGKVLNGKEPFSELFIIFFFFFWLNSRISLTRIDQNLKLGQMIDFDDTQTIGIVKFM